MRQTTPPHRSRIPKPLSRFVGRDEEIRELVRLLERSRLVTLTGAGGVGKTRLGLEVADRLGGVRERAILVQLGGLSDPALVPDIVAQAFGLPGQAAHDRADQLELAIGRQPILMVLDNCEHLLLACADLAERLLQSCPELRVLATSREPLRVAGEVTWRVPSLSFPWPARMPAVHDLDRYEAVRLFVERASDADPRFRLTEHNARAVAEICYKLDGIPLALELAASRVRVMDLDDIVQRLADRFRLLSSGQHGAPARQQTLRASINWSHDLLGESERRLFRRLAVFAGGWSVDAAESVCAFDGLEREHVLELLSLLVERSLVHRSTDAPSTRYRFLETLRAFATEKVVESGELERVRERHARAYIALAETAAQHLAGPEQLEWLSRLETEHENLRAAFNWCADADQPELELRLVVALWQLWEARGHLQEGRSRAMHALARAESASPALVSAALFAAGRLSVLTTGTGPAGELHTRGLELARSLYDPRLEALHLIGLGRVQQLQRHFEMACDLYTDALHLARQLRDPELCVLAIEGYGRTADWIGRVEDAIRAYDEALAIVAASGDRVRAARIQCGRGIVELRSGDAARAERMLEQAYETARNVGDLLGTALALHNLGAATYRRGKHADAFEYHRQALALMRDLGDRTSIALGLDNLAVMAAEANQPRRAARLHGAAAALLSAVGHTYQFDEEGGHMRAQRAARTALGEREFQREAAAGAALPLDRAIAEALEESAPVAPEDTPWHHLSRREREVMRLIAQGLTNRQIGERLIIAERTVDTHVQRILSKLGCATRSEAVARVADYVK